MLHTNATQNDAGDSSQTSDVSTEFLPTDWGTVVSDSTPDSTPPATDGTISRQVPLRQVPSNPATPRREASGPNFHQDVALFLRGVLNTAVKRGASDIHFEPHIDSYHVRFRVDGVLQDYFSRPYAEYSAVLNTIKVLADVDISEHNLPLDGHIEFVLEEVDDSGATGVSGGDAGGVQHIYDVRISTFPSVNGEVVVMRLLNRADALLPISQIGMDIGSLEVVREMLVSSFGLILITGPTGSGKTTTLYSLLQELKSKEKNMITLEDPIEFHLDWLRQCEIRENRGFTFERAMSAVLRQDPDVLMVGEIRDAKTAEYAVRSALVGNLVGSTIHANTATGTIARLLDLGVPRSILSHSLNGIIAQRLVRTVCPHCKVVYTPAMFYLTHFGLQDMPGPYYHGTGCDQCNGLGFKGRIGIYSVMYMTESLRSLVFEQRSLVEVQQHAIDHGMKTLKMDAASKILKGITTVEEAARII